MTNIPFVKKLLFIFCLAGLAASCDNDFNNLDSSIIADDIHHDNITRAAYNVVAYDRASSPIQSNNLPENLLGVYNGPFGTTKAHFVTQLEILSTDLDEEFTNPIIDTVYLHVPYKSTLVSTDGTTGQSTYTLNGDYFYGNYDDNSFKLTIAENRYFLRTSDPQTNTAQKYFSDQRPDFELGGTVLYNGNNFTFSSQQIQRMSGTKVVERLTPGIFADLKDNITFFQDKLFSAAGKATLGNNSAFKEYFRGLLFTVDQVNNGSAMAKLNFSEGKIVVRYHENATPTKIKSFTLSLKGNTANFLEHSPNADYSSALADGSTNDSRLYVKGGAGSMAVIKLQQDFIDELNPDLNSQQPVLINEANLVFHIDRSKIPVNPSNPVKQNNPLRVYLYDLKNNRPLYDYYVDVTTNPADNRYNKIVHGGLYDESNSRYKIRITNHINNIIHKDSANVPLGLVITDNINLIANASLKNPFTADGETVKFAPAATVFAPLGTVLHGSNSEDAEKRLKLEIFYTKPE